MTNYFSTGDITRLTGLLMISVVLYIRLFLYIKVNISTAISRLIDRTRSALQYAWTGVWSDGRSTFRVRVLKTLNLTVRSFLNKDLQSKAMSLTYSTVLAAVPAFALLFAIGRGFGFQNLLQSSLYVYFPSQEKALNTALGFVDNYLSQASQGVFVGVGIVFLLWTLISLMSSIEQAFNQIWDIKEDRSFMRKVTDYIAICLVVPILMVCSSGISIFMSTAISEHFAFLGGAVDWVLDATPFLLVWIAFTLSFMLFPNTKVQFKYAAISGFVCGVAFQILQLLFVNGQIYVSKYNAIYGSFAFLPLMLIWLQLSWLILLIGCMFTYAAQNVVNFNYNAASGSISANYLKQVAVVLMRIIVERQQNHQPPLTLSEISNGYGMPIRLVKLLAEIFRTSGIAYFVVLDDDKEGLAPAIDAGTYTIGDLFAVLDRRGQSDFIPDFRVRYSPLLAVVAPVIANHYGNGASVTFASLPAITASHRG